MIVEEQSSSRLAAGPLGPVALVQTRRKQKVGSAGAIHRVCARLLDDGLRPTFALVRDNAAGFAEATLGRKQYRPIVHAAQARHDAIAAGEWREDGEPDAFALMAIMIAKGFWAPLEPAVDGVAEIEAAEDGRSAAYGNDGDHDGDSREEFDGRDEQQGRRRDTPTDTLHDRMTALERKVGRLEAEVRRRDEQLYNALAVARSRGDQVRRQRQTIAELRAEIDTLSAEPLPLRPTRVWEEE